MQTGWVSNREEGRGQLERVSVRLPKRENMHATSSFTLTRTGASSANQATSPRTFRLPQPEPTETGAGKTGETGLEPAESPTTIGTSVPLKRHGGMCIASDCPRWQSGRSTQNLESVQLISPQRPKRFTVTTSVLASEIGWEQEESPIGRSAFFLSRKLVNMCEVLD